MCFLISTFTFSSPEHCLSGQKWEASEVPRFCACGVGVGEENAPVLVVEGNRCREPLYWAKKLSFCELGKWSCLLFNLGYLNHVVVGSGEVLVREVLVSTCDFFLAFSFPMTAVVIGKYRQHAKAV